MATVIDSLLIELGLDTSKFDASQKKAVDSLRKFDDQQQKTAKNTEKSTKDMGDGFTAMKDSLIAFGTILGGLGAFKAFIQDTTRANVELGRGAHFTNLSARELKTWGDIAEITGGSVESMTATIKGLQQSLVGLKYGDTGMVQAVSMLGAWKAFDTKNMTVDLYKLSDAIVNFRKTHTEAETVKWATTLGINEDNLLLLEQESEALREQYRTYDELNKKIEENAKSSGKLHKEWIDFKKSLESIGQWIMSWLTPVLIGVLKVGEWVADGTILRKWIEKKIKGEAEPEEVSAIGSQVSSRNIRNKNPGNIKYGEFAQQHGAIAADKDGFAIFASMEAGQAAQEALLKQKYARGLDTIHKLYYGDKNTKGWLGSGADLKDAKSAIANVMKMTGLGEYQHIDSNQLAMIRQAMQSNEGMIGAKMSTPTSTNKTVNSNVAIQNVNVNTQATDASGIAKEIPAALQQNMLINAGIIGVD